jgi:hypothetical protein
MSSPEKIDTVTATYGAPQPDDEAKGEQAFPHDAKYAALQLLLDGVIDLAVEESFRGSCKVSPNNEPTHRPPHLPLR